MALRASACSVEVGLAGFRVANQNVLKLIGLTERGVIDALVQERGDIRDLGVSQRKLGHALILAALFDNRADFLAAFVIKHDNGADEIGSAFAPLGVCAVAEAAVRGERCLASLGCGSVYGWNATLVRAPALAASRWGRLLGGYDRSHHG